MAKLIDPFIGVYRRGCAVLPLDEAVFEFEEGEGTHILPNRSDPKYEITARNCSPSAASGAG
jgi:hypothetical protein